MNGDANIPDEPPGGTTPVAMGNGTNGQGGATATPEGLSGQLGAGSLSAPVQMATEPLRIVSPQEGKSHMAGARLGIAGFSVLLLAFIVVAAFITLWRREPIDDLTRLLEIIFAPIVAVVAAAVAFYYRGSVLRDDQASSFQLKRPLIGWRPATPGLPPTELASPDELNFPDRLVPFYQDSSAS